MRRGSPALRTRRLFDGWSNTALASARSRHALACAAPPSSDAAAATAQRPGGAVGRTPRIAAASFVGPGGRAAGSAGEPARPGLSWPGRLPPEGAPRFTNRTLHLQAASSLPPVVAAVARLTKLVR